jgi:hypothetical protein
MYEVTFQDYQVPPPQNFETGDTLSDNPPPDPATLIEFIDDVETILTGTDETIDDDELALLAPDEWEIFLAGLLGFVSAGPLGSDQNSYYDDHSNEAPLGVGFVQFMDDFGWMDSIERMAGYHYYDYLQGHDPELLAASEAAHRFVYAATSGGGGLASLAGMPFSLTANGFFLTFTWHNGSAPVATFAPDPNDPHSVVVTAAGLGYWTAQATPDPSAGSGATDVPYAWDFTGMSTDALATMHYVSEALQYLDDSPAAVELLRAAVLAGVKIRIVTGATESAYHPETNVVFWNPAMAVRFVNGAIMSPAMVLAHELAHGVGRILNPVGDPDYGNTEDRRVIMNYEQVIAGQLGEPSRSDHNGTTVFSIQNVTYHRPPGG